MRFLACTRLLIPIVFLTTGASGSAHASLPGSDVAPAAQGSYMVKALDQYANAYWARVAGRDTGLPPHSNGHDEFAAQWTRQVLSALSGLHAGVYRQTFHTPGFRGLPAGRPGVNVMVAVPGTKHPEQAVVLGTHYDGEPSSKGSAFDDTSGCMILLGLVRTLGSIWRKDGPPSLTVEFVLFDAEEQGLVGSSIYTFNAQHGALMPHPILMLNEEQSGVGYPARPFGLRSQPPLPSYVITNDQLPAFLGPQRPVEPSVLRLLTRRLRQADATAFTGLRAVYSPMSFRGGTASVFGAADGRYVKIGPAGQCCSDNDPFQVMGVPTVTFSGNFDFYTGTAKPWSYPFDQPWDTPAAMACDTGGSPQPGRILEAALDLPQVTSALLVQEYAPAGRGSGGVAVFSSLPRRGHSISFAEIGAVAAAWNFGDGHSARGASVTHVYRQPGSYQVSVEVGGRARAWRLTVPKTQNSFDPPFGTGNPPRVRPWQPAELQNIEGCRSPAQ